MPRVKTSLPHEVFLSHSNRDRKFAHWLASELRRHAVPVWYSETNVMGAQQWHDEIGDALQRCDWFLVILSPSAIRSMWVKRELLFALENERYACRIIPVLHRQCEFKRLSWALSRCNAWTSPSR